jgi:hypothetical protein
MMLMNDKGASEMIYTLRGIQPMQEEWYGKHRYDRVLIPYDKRKDYRFKSIDFGALNK